MHHQILAQSFIQLHRHQLRPSFKQLKTLVHNLKCRKVAVPEVKMPEVAT